MNDYTISRVYGPWLTDAERRTLQDEHARYLRAAADTYGDTIRGATHVWQDEVVQVAGCPVRKFRLTSQVIIARTAATS